MRQCSPFTRYGLTTVGIALVLAHNATAAGTAEQSCQRGRYAAAAKYLACEHRATGDQFGGGFSSFQAVVSKCRLKYGATWVKLQAQASGTGSTCDGARFASNGDGTVTDRLTGLHWERKTDDLSLHDKDDVYPWSAGGGGFTAADGAVHTSFIATLNGGGCFAGQCDWRLPTRAELQTILSEGYPCTTSPCIDQTVFGPSLTIADDYWSSTTSATASGNVWSVDFTDGFVSAGSKNDVGHVRAVRGGP